ncbi:MAG TPA: alpha/beta family hydrolase [Candidatus Binatia bacterium]|nr:alpha/beta family hydrolase [Candidatus Binatia bacterium]
MKAAPEVFTDVTVDPFVRGWLHRPASANGDALVLTHGAGGNCNAPLLVALADKFSDAGFLVLRCDLPFRQDRPYGPPGPHDGKRDRAGLLNAVDGIKKQISGRVFLGGHSYGGRQSSILCSESAEAARIVAGLLLLSYPLHPPRRPEQLRTQHFFNLKTPALFVHGTQDPFATTAEMEQALKLIQARTKLLEVESAGHDLGFRGKAKSEQLPVRLLTEFQSFYNSKNAGE